jgi:lipoprotein-anchoring transpeptidase ErfK/SrfK
MPQPQRRFSRQASAHGVGKAIDISGFELSSGKFIPIKPDGDEAMGNVVDAVWTAACGWLMTVVEVFCGVALALALVDGGPVHAQRARPQSLSAAAVDQAACSDTTSQKVPRAAMFKAEVLLDRLDLSPGVIDGKTSENAGKAIVAFQRSRGLAASGKLDQPTWDKLCASMSAPVMVAYTITDDDVRGPFVHKIPRDFEGMARLHRLGYRSAGQLLAEKFHTSEEMIKLLNRGKRLDSAGTVIIVPNVADGRPDGQVFRIEVDKPAKLVRAFGRNDELIAFYPASIGSSEKPAPSGTYRVRQVVENPIYHYDPRFHFKGVRSKRRLTIAPGPNNPVGLVWIDLTKASYGIHGTPRPEEIGKTQSHGCIRLTNWDALDLAKRVRKGTPVAFLDETQAVSRQ